MLEATKDSIRLLSEATSDAIIDSLAPTKSVLEELYKSGAGGFSLEELQQDLAIYQQVHDRIRERCKLASNPEEPFKIITPDDQALLEKFREKYSDFLPKSTIGRSEGLEKISNASELIFSALENKTDVDGLSKIYSGLAILSEDLEKYISYFSKSDELIGSLKVLTSKILESAVLASKEYSVHKEYNFQDLEMRDELLAVKNTARGILWQIDNHEKEKKSSVEDVLNWLDTSPGWAGDDFEECLDYVNQTRK